MVQPRIAAGSDETMLAVAYDAGAVGGRWSLTRLLDALSDIPARLLGLYPQKGAIRVDSDADMVVFDPTRTRKISADSQHSGAGFTLYEGRQVSGAVDIVMQRGRVIVEGGEVRSTPGNARFIRTSTAHLYQSANSVASV